MLDTQFGIQISLETYKSYPKNVINDLLNLAAVSREGIVNFIDKFFKNYVTKHELCLDSVLTNYIDKMTNSNSRQDIIIDILPCISSTTVRLENIKVILNRASIPWNETIWKIAESAVKESHPLTKDIQHMIDNMPIQILLKKYFKRDCINTHISDGADLNHIVKVILNSNDEDKFKDIDILAEKFPTSKYFFSFFVVDYYLKQKTYHKALAHLETLDDNIKFDCAVTILNSAQTYLDLGFYDSAKNYIEILSAITTILTNGENALANEVYRENCLQIQNLYTLKTKYDVKTSIPQLESGKFQLLSSLVAKIYRSVELQEKNWIEACKNVEEIARCLNFDEEEGLFELIKQSKSLSCMIVVGEILLEKDRVKTTNLCKLAAPLFKHMCDDDTLDFHELSNDQG